MRLRLERVPAPVWAGPLVPLVAVVLTFLVTALLVLWAGANPFQAFYYFIVAPLTGRVSAVEVLVKSTPLLLTGAAVMFAFSAGYWNIGAEGQLYAGAVAAAWLGIVLAGIPAVLAVPLMLLGGFVAGLLWASVPGLLKVKLAVDEVVTTLLLNSVMAYLVSALLNGPWRSPESGWPQSPEIAPAAMLPRLLGSRYRLHLGFVVALVVLALIWFVLNRTALGLRMRAAGLSPGAARFAGLRVDRILLTAALVSGGIAGLAGVTEVAGIHFHLIDAISPGFGYTGIIIAMLGALNPIGVALAALFIGLIQTGSQSVSRALGVPAYLGDVVQATLLLFTLAVFVLQNYRVRLVGRPAEGQPAAAPAPEGPRS